MRRTDIGAFADAVNRAPWMLIVSGVLTILFGILALMYPGAALAALVVLFGVYAIAIGIVEIIGAFQTRRYWPLLVVGIISLAAGIIAFAYPRLTLATLYYIIGAWAILRGIADVIAAAAEPMSSGSRWLLGLTGVVTILFGILLFANPTAGIVTLVFLIAFYALFVGIARIWLGLEIRQAAGTLRGAIQH